MGRVRLPNLELLVCSKLEDNLPQNNNKNIIINNEI